MLRNTLILFFIIAFIGNTAFSQGTKYYSYKSRQKKYFISSWGNWSKWEYDSRADRSIAFLSRGIVFSQKENTRIFKNIRLDKINGLWRTYRGDWVQKKGVMSGTFTLDIKGYTYMDLVKGKDSASIIIWFSNNLYARIFGDGRRSAVSIEMKK